jgi:hypothetical protein
MKVSTYLNGIVAKFKNKRIAITEGVFSDDSLFLQIKVLVGDGSFVTVDKKRGIQVVQIRLSEESASFIAYYFSEVLNKRRYEKYKLNSKGDQE